MTCYLIELDKDNKGQLYMRPWIYTVAREIESIQKGYVPGKTLFKICPYDDKEETAKRAVMVYLNGQFAEPERIERWVRNAKARYEEFKRTRKIPEVKNPHEWE
ncbi:hypothetical protein [Rubrobacter calidifluminis]|uniref:hypothetical protein n=1 Tax=Rubrobacter calidifluminis TaxID=1392640 RepID=UPI00235F3B5F|nr:hypothetical protein [Rubrobacter calidifluminis]